MADVLGDLDNPYKSGSFMWYLWVIKHENIIDEAVSTVGGIAQKVDNVGDLSDAQRATVGAFSTLIGVETGF
jgi:hypothetical protein